MKLFEERILKDGNVLGENILKVDSFLTHQSGLPVDEKRNWEGFCGML